MNIQLLKVTHHNRQIDAMFYTPKAEGKYPTVIFSHGYNGHKTDFDSTAKYLAQQGICSFTYTFCGGSTRDESGMPTTEMTLFTEKEDLEAVISFVKELEPVDTNYIFAFGASQGGLVTALTVENMSDDIKGMILLYPAFCIADDWRERFLKEEDIPEEEELWGMQLGRKYFESIREFYIFEEIGKYKNNVLVMHGDKDPVVEIGYSEKILETYTFVKLEVFEGEGHGFTEEGTERMTKLLYDFIKENTATKEC